jgi:hypothetical protein
MSATEGQHANGHGEQDPDPAESKICLIKQWACHGRGRMSDFLLDALLGIAREKSYQGRVGGTTLSLPWP